MDVSPFIWLATVAGVLVLLGVDLGVASRRPHAVGFREATAWSVFYVAVALAFGVGVGVGVGVAAPQSLAMIAAVLAVVTAASILKARRHPEARAHAGSLRRHGDRAGPD